MSLAVLLEYVLLYNNTLSVSSDCIRHILWNNGQPYSAIRRCKVFICYIRYTTYILDNKITFGVYRITLPIYFSGCAFLCNSIRAINTGASRSSSGWNSRVKKWAETPVRADAAAQGAAWLSGSKDCST